MNSYTLQLKDKCGNGVRLSIESLNTLSGKNEVTEKDQTLFIRSEHDYKTIEEKILSSDSDLKILNPYKTYELKADIDCQSCAINVEEHLKKDRYISDAAFNYEEGVLRVTTSHSVDKIKKLSKEAEDDIVFKDDDQSSKTLYFSKKDIKYLPDIKDFLLKEGHAESVSIAKNSLIIKSEKDTDLLSLKIREAFEDVKVRENKYPITFQEIRVIASIVILLISYITHINYIAILSFLLSGYDVIYKAIRNLFKGKLFDENFLMTLATIGAILIGAYEESAFVMVLYQIGEYFQKRASLSSRRSILKIMDISEDKATVIEGGKEIEVDSQSVEVGTTLLIKPGKRVPIDSIVLDGTSHLDTKAINGEMIPKKAEKGVKILSGYINKEGSLLVKTIEKYEDSAASKIKKLLSESEKKKAKSEEFITKFSRYYTPIVTICAILIGVIPPLFGIIGWKDSLYRACSLLVISCPCALILSVPLTYFSSMGLYAKKGIIVKSDDVINSLSNIDTVATDKTGTITEGVFEVVEVRAFNGETEESVLEYASAIEKHSTHPIASAISLLETKNQLEAKNVKEIEGIGLEGTIGGNIIKIGSDKILHDKSDKIAFDNRTHCYVTKNDIKIGEIYLFDKLKDGVKEVVESLKEEKVKDVVLLSGDKKESVEYTLKGLGYTSYYSSLLPDEKTKIIDNLKNEGKKVLYVGDGINDAPSLMEADVGVSMGKIGSDLAIEASDVVIVDDNIKKVPLALRISKRTKRIVTENISVSLSAKILVFLLSIFGISNLYLAVLADTGVLILAVLNSLRAMYIRDKG